jgi:hypothetical protein
VIFLALGGRSGRSRGGSRGRGRSSGGLSGYQPLTHIELAFLPPNTTSHLQPLDAGIIASFKNYFKRKYCHHILGLLKMESISTKRKLILKKQ